MSDPITTVVAVISEHPQAAAAVASIYGVAKPFLAKVLGPAADELGEIGRDYIKGRRAKNAERTLSDADKLLAEAGREPQQVPLSIAVPLLEAASLQDEPSLAEKWAALLANAADPAQRVQVLPSFTSFLKELTAYEALLLECIAKHARQASSSLPVNVFIPAAVMREAMDANTTEDIFYISLDNLSRLNLVLTQGNKLLPNGSSPIGIHPFFNDIGPGKERIAVTHLGLAFLAAVIPPTP